MRWWQLAVAAVVAVALLAGLGAAIGRIGPPGAVAVPPPRLDEAAAAPPGSESMVAALPGFYPAEAYHQDYAARHPDDPYIQINDLPKLANLRRAWPRLYRSAPAAHSDRQ